MKVSLSDNIGVWNTENIISGYARTNWNAISSLDDEPQKSDKRRGTCRLGEALGLSWTKTTSLKTVQPSRYEMLLDGVEVEYDEDCVRINGERWRLSFDNAGGICSQFVDVLY